MVHRDLVVRSHQIYLGKDGATVQVGGEILQVWNWVTVGDSGCVQGSVVPTWSPVAGGFLWDHVKGEAHGLEEGRMMPKSSMCSNSCFAAWRRSGESLRGRA